MEIEILTVKEAAKLLKLSVPTIYQLKAEKKIPCAKVGNSVRFIKSDLINWLSDESKKSIQ